MHFSSLIFSLAVLGGSAPSAFAQTKRLPPVIRERRGPKAKVSGTIRSGSRTNLKKKAPPAKQAEFGNTAQFIKEENTLPLKEDKGGFLKSDAGYGRHGGHMSGPDYDYDYRGPDGYEPHGSHLSGPHGGHMSGPDYDYDYRGPDGYEPHGYGPHGSHMSGPAYDYDDYYGPDGYGPHGSHMSGPHYPEMSYDYDYDYDYYGRGNYGHHYYGPDSYEPHGHGSPHGVEPVSHEEARAIMHIAKHCPTEVMAMNNCYPNQEVLMMCTNCIWEGLLGSGMNCTELEVDYESCISYCLPECDEKVSAVYECGLESGMCEGGGLDDYLDDYLMSYGPDGYGIDDIIPPMSNEEASIIGEIVSHCEDAVMTLGQCYGEDQVQMVDCINCIYEGFQITDFSCEGLEVDYERCGDVCFHRCDEAIRGLYQCGKDFLPCGDVYGSPEMSMPPSMATPSQGVYLAEE